MREQFRNELDGLQADVASIVYVIDEVTRDSVSALLNRDVELANSIFEREEEIDSMCINIEEHVLEVMATQHPVARDLRLLQSMAYIAIHLERMGDHAVGIAKAALRTADRKGPQTLIDLIQSQASLVYRVLDSMREALEKMDIELARKLPELDEPIDQLYKQFFRELARLTDEDEIEWASQMIMASRSLERISDYAVDIGERLLYLVTGVREFEPTEDDEAQKS